MGVSINLHPQPHLASPCIRTIKCVDAAKLPEWMRYVLLAIPLS